jgi:hypothetical protein
VLRHAITSVQRQTFTDFEMIVVGDACTDDTEQVVGEMNDGRLRWFNRAENSGSQSLPNNDGLRLARGRYVAYLGHDDVWHPEHLATMVARIEEAQAGLVYSVCLWLGPPEAPRHWLTGFEPAGGFEAGTLLPPTSVMHRRELGDAVGGWRDYRDLVQWPDHDFITRVWQADHGFAGTNRLTAFKFPSVWRPNSYVERPSHEQPAYLARMAAQPDFVEQELLAALAALSPRPRPVGAGAAPGEMVAHLREIRGLDAQPLRPPPLRLRLRRLARPAKAAAVRLLRRIESL